jgi:methionyl-tRNA formyltransferase
MLTAKHLKIFFFGAPLFSKEVLSFLLKNNIPINTVITHPDQPAKRKQMLTPTEVKLFSLKHKLKIKEFSKLDNTALNFFKEEKPDLFITASYGAIIPQEILDIPRLGALNVHPSLLPKLRGATPIQTALLQGLNKTGASIMLMDAGMDTGNIIRQKQINIKPTDRYPELEQELINLSNELLLPIIQSIIKTNKKPSSFFQDDSRATFTKLIKKQDGLINWNKSAQELYNQWRAFYNWPQIYTFYQGQKLTLTEIELFSKNDILKESRKFFPGTIFKNSNNLLIMTGDEPIKITKLQLAGKKELPTKDFLNGQNKFIGSILK